TDTAWKDKLTSYDGQSITYDEIGNPTDYMGADMTWLGRQMMTYSKNGTNISYTYDSDGLRTSKTVNGVKHNYYYVDGQLRYEKNGDSYEIYYTYDADGRPVLATKRDLVAKKNYQYYLITNTRGDVIETRNGDGNVNARFVYDAWGKLIAVTDANGNALSQNSFAYQISLKYRGYVYDNETGLYYLQSRYYDPEVGRFINADDVDFNIGFVGFSNDNTSHNVYVYFCSFTEYEYEYSNSDFISNSLNTFLKSVLSFLEKVFTIKYDVPLYSQGNLSLCWAYCQVMIEDYKSGVIRTKEEADMRAKELAIFRNGEEDWNRGSWPTNCKSYTLWGRPIPALIDLTSIVELYNLLELNGPVYALYESEDSSHLVVVTGVNLLRNVVYTNNPWGRYGEQSFYDYLNGVDGAKKTYKLINYFVTK
ncbi:MAG: RHS repeat-associated core domain-containing protein, partial [Acutalibacteraceae bacterium]